MSTANTSRPSTASGASASPHSIKSSEISRSDSDRSLRSKCSIIKQPGNIPFPVLNASSSSCNHGPYSADEKDHSLEIKHGMLPDYTLRVKGHIHSVLYYPKKQSCTIFHSDRIENYTKNNLHKSIKLEEAISTFDKLLHATELGVYIGVCEGKLILLDRTFEILYEVESPGRISAAVYNPWSLEIVTASPGNITTWMFRKGAKTIASSLVINDGLDNNEDISLLHLEACPGKSQRVFACIRCSLKIFLLANGKLVEHMKNIHTKPISSALFFRPLQFLLTASKDGSIKVWDSSRKLRCTFIGHSNVVTGLLPYPYGPMVISSSLDSTLRVWDLTSLDQLQIIDHTLPVEGVSCEPGTYYILSYSTRQVKVWYIQQLYSRNTNVGSPSLLLQATTHPLVPTRVLSVGADAAVRVVSPLSKEVLTTALLPPQRKVTSIAYFSFKEQLYVLDDIGTISVFDTRENPSSLKVSWSLRGDQEHYCCLALYEIAMDQEEISELLTSDKWFGVLLEARQLKHSRLAEKDPLQVLQEGHSFLLGGTDQGNLAIIHTLTGEMRFSVPAHKGKVVAISCDPKRRHVITAGLDPTLHVWELYPHSKELLSHLLSFTLATPPSIMVASRDRLGVARNDPEHTSFVIDLFNISNKEVYSGDPDNSHSDPIVALDVAPKMKLFVSCSMDSTVRIWTEDNHPVRVLQLNCPAEDLVFCSLQADILISLHTHLHVIANFTYFTDALNKQLMSTYFTELVDEVQLGWSKNINSLPEHDRARLSLQDNIISEDSYYGDLSSDEVAMIEEAARMKMSDISMIRERENEIKAILQGSITTKKSHHELKKKERETMWRTFLRMLRPEDTRLKIDIPDEDTFDPDTYGIEPAEIRIKSPFSEGPRLKFFPPLATFDPPYPLAPDGILPNSIILNALRKSDADKALAKTWKLPTLSAKQRQLLTEVEEEEEELEENESDLMKRLQAAMTAMPSETSSSPSPPSTPPPPPPEKAKVISPRKPIQKLIAPKLKSPRLSPTPSPQRSPTPSPPPTPLPDFIVQFMGTHWFTTLFPNAGPKTFPKPWTVASFVSLLLSKLKSEKIDMQIKADIINPIHQLLTTYNPPNWNEVYLALLDLLQATPIPSTRLKAHRKLVTEALNLLISLDQMDPYLAVLLMLHFIEGGIEIQRLIMDYFIKHGLDDPIGYFKTALLKMGHDLQGKTMNTYNIFVKCQKWLEYWTEKFCLNKQSKNVSSKKPAKKAHKDSFGRKSSNVSTGLHQHKDEPSQPPLPHNDSISVINYFVAVEHENELARLRVPPPPPPLEPEEECKRNSIIPLPKINKNGMLIRLGETHCSCCHPERETTLMLLHQLPYHDNRPDPSNPYCLWRKFTQTITLPLIPQTINPFLTAEEKAAEEEMMGLGRLKSGMRKYFIPEKSYVRTLD